MKYIDAEKLIAEVERRRLSNRYIDTEGYEAELFEIIDSLQQEQTEVDLENEVDFEDVWKTYYDDHLFNRFPMPSKREIAHHFYELGRKGGRK